jgi:Uma2 family endonuclease
MSTGVATKTVDDLWNLPDDHKRHELVDGALRTMEPSGAEHGRVTSTVGFLLERHVRQAACGVTFGAETGFILRRDPDTVRAPDAAFVSKERAEAAGRVIKFWPGAPDFAAEVVSPSDSFAEVEAKALAWLDAGTKLVLVVDPARRTATTYRGHGEARVHGAGDTLDVSDGVPGWSLAVAELFG